MQFLTIPLLFLSGMFFPVNSVPQWLGVITKLNPVTYGVDAVRQLFLAGEGLYVSGGLNDNLSSNLGVSVFGHTMSITEDALVVGVVGVVLMRYSVWSFNRQE